MRLAESRASLLRAGRVAGLNALVQAIDHHAQVAPVEGADVPTWTITIDPDTPPAPVPDWACIGHLSGSSTFRFEQRVEITTR